MRTFTLRGVIAAILVLVSTALASAQILPPPPPPPPPPAAPSATAPGGGGGGGGFGAGGYAAIATLATATYLAVLNPMPGSDSILANTIHDEWKCRFNGDRRPRCGVWNTLSYEERARLYRSGGFEPPPPPKQTAKRKKTSGRHRAARVVETPVPGPVSSPPILAAIVVDRHRVY